MAADIRTVRASILHTMRICADHARDMRAWSRESDMGASISYARRMFYQEVGALAALAGVLKGIEGVRE